MSYGQRRSGSIETMDGVVVNIDRCAWAETDQDGSITVDFSGCGCGCGVGRPTWSPIIGGRSYTVRLYRLRAEILGGTWTFPVIADGWPPPQRSAP